MSFSDHIGKIVETHIGNFVAEISKKYNIDKNSLMKLWSQSQTTQSTQSTPQEQSSNVNEPAPAPMSSPEELLKLSKTELTSLCKIRGVKTSGTKQEIVERLTGQTLKEDVKKEDPKKKAKSSEPEVKPVLKTIKEFLPTIQLKKNSFGYFEHPDTKFVFDRTTNTVLGKQNVSGDVDPLTEEDIEMCNKYNFKFKIPENLNNDKTQTVIEGLDDEDMIEEEIGDLDDGEEEEYGDGSEEEYVEEEYVEEAE